MLSRRKRLRRQEVEEVLSSGRSARAGHLQMKFITNSHPLRAAIIVPKSLVRKANKRNALRRAAYTALAKTTLPHAKGSAVFFVRTVPTNQMATTFAGDLSTLLAQANRVKI